MNKVKFFLVADGILLFVGILFFFYLYTRRNKGMGGFRDDLWDVKQAQWQSKAQAFDEQLDKKILLGFQEEKKADTAPEPKAAPGPKPQFRTPNFKGRPHEVLGVPADANRDLILSAYKYWIKCYHPDRVHHLGPSYVEQAKRRAGLINAARDHLLEAIKK